ncbi:MAG TPA: ParB/RepB/Spo0J family partition protein [Enterovirga sp.]|nr:ParB/RepB/Spo0J family partition protein [Enterovirga sp.]
MAEDLVKSRLGRGLAALIGDVDDAPPPPEASKAQRRVPIEFLRPNPRNPRTRFVETDLEDLAGSIRERGIIQPIVARPLAGLADVFEIIAGERRWRAAQRAGLHEVPIVVIEADDRTALELAIIENVQRADLNAIEEAAGYDKLIVEHGYSQGDLATTLGKSRSHVANTLRLLKLPDGVKDRVTRGELSAGHARALLSVRNPEAVAAKVVEQGLNVREVEHIAKAESEAESGKEVREIAPRRRKPVDADTRALEATLEDALGLIVRIDDRGGAGELRIRYANLDQLASLCRMLRSAAA